MKSKLFFLAIILLISGIASAQEKPDPAGKIMDEAYKLAATEGKSVMIVFFTLPGVAGVRNLRLPSVIRHVRIFSISIL